MPPPYALRHTFASLSIAAGVLLFELARFIGTSAEQIDRTYGHLLPEPSSARGRRWTRSSDVLVRKWYRRGRADESENPV